MKYLLTILALFILGSSDAQNWAIQEGYEISFSGKKAEGSFFGLAGTIQFNPNEPEQAKFAVTLDANTIETGNTTKNKHARSENWFFVKEFPLIRFQSESVTATSSGFLTTGILDLRGVKKQVSIAFTFIDKGEQGEFQGTLQVNRKDHGIEGNLMEFLVGDEFEVQVSVPVTRI